MTTLLIIYLIGLPLTAVMVLYNMGMGMPFDWLDIIAAILWPIFLPILLIATLMR